MGKTSSIKKILILSANPQETPRLRWDRELREIREVKRKAIKRKTFELISETAVRTTDIQQYILEYQPQIIHFCGHGTGSNGLVFEDDTGKAKLVSTKALTDLFKLCRSYVECVVLNACYSLEQAKEIANHIQYVAAMRQELGDQAAIEYSRGFYTAIFAGKSYDMAHEFGRNAIQLEGLCYDDTPIIKKNLD